MRINIAKSSGFCLGVKRAIKMALVEARNHRHVYMLGDIVHNEEVVRQIRKAGIKKVAKLKPTKQGVFLIRAHGLGLKTINQARRLGYRIEDATCPMVKEIQRISKNMEQQGYRIIIIGDKRHAEVKGISGQLSKGALIIDSEKNIALDKIKGIIKAACVVQSTQNIEKVLKIVEILKQYIKNLKFYNTICRPTMIKQAEIKNLARENDLIIVIGSRKSANTKRLYQLAKSINKQTRWIQSKNELRAKWFKGKKHVGVASGASTPDSTTQGVLEQIGNYARAG